MHTLRSRFLPKLSISKIGVPGLAVALLLTATPFATTATAELEIGQTAPTFSTNDIEGNEISLEQYRGKYVVLEWFNSGCPYVRKHYQAKAMQELQEELKKKDVVWLTINSTEAEHQDYKDAAASKKLVEQMGIMSTAFILDANGTIGHSYGAKTTPHVFVVDPDGKLVYRGAIDNTPDIDVDPRNALNYITAAFRNINQEQPIEIADTKAYGCSIKYAN